MPIIVRRSPGGYRTPRGSVVETVQRALGAKGSPVPSVDGIFGNDTETALKAWQTKAGRPVTGTVDEKDWAALTTAPLPSLFERCLQLTLAFEGHGYTKAAGNFDGAFLTWGIIGFTLKGGSLNLVINGIPRAVLDAALGADKAKELLAILEATMAEKEAWANGISAGAQKAGLVKDWSDAFTRLGQTPEAQAAQRTVARDNYWGIAERDFRRYGLSDALDMALCFDTAVQNGGINKAKADLIQQRMAPLNPKPTGQARRELMANAIADGSSERWRENVRRRRLTIATGDGEANGARYRLADWGLTAQEGVVGV